mgnify:FL=1
MLHRKKPLFERIFPLQIPLSWLQLTSERKRFFVAIAGITFAVTMMLFQMGLRGALFKQVVAPILLLDGDVFVVGYNYEYFGVGRGFPKVRLNQCYAVDSVESAQAVKLGGMSFKNPSTGLERDIFTIAFDPSKKVFADPEIIANQNVLKKGNYVLFDRLSRDQYGDISGLFAKKGAVETELSGIRTKIGGLISIGATFAADGNVLMSLDTFDKIMRDTSQTVNVGVIKLKPNASAKQAVKELKKIFPKDAVVMTRDDFIKNEKEYWAVRTPIGFVIGASMAVAIFVGAVIVYQILYTDVSDHIPEYATLKAIGFDDGFFVKIILQESLILSFLGFIPGALFAEVLYYLTRTFAYMPTYLSVENLAIVFFLTLFMCAVAGLLATRKLRSANPADIF